MEQDSHNHLGIHFFKKRGRRPTLLIAVFAKDIGEAWEKLYHAKNQEEKMIWGKGKESMERKFITLTGEQVRRKYIHWLTPTRKGHGSVYLSGTFEYIY